MSYKPKLKKGGRPSLATDPQAPTKSDELENTQLIKSSDKKFEENFNRLLAAQGITPEKFNEEFKKFLEIEKQIRGPLTYCNIDHRSALDAQKLRLKLKIESSHDKQIKRREPGE